VNITNDGVVVNEFAFDARVMHNLLGDVRSSFPESLSPTRYVSGREDELRLICSTWKQYSVNSQSGIRDSAVTSARQISGEHADYASRAATYHGRVAQRLTAR
jgi:hypothetical protein